MKVCEQMPIIYAKIKLCEGVMGKIRKLYCYVDETGQDTLGRVFVVACVVLESERDTMSAGLETAEKLSGLRKKK